MAVGPLHPVYKSVSDFNGGAVTANTHLPRTLEPHDLLAVLQDYFLLVVLAFAPLEPNEQERADTEGERIPFCGCAIPCIDQSTCVRIIESAARVFNVCCEEYAVR